MLAAVALAALLCGAEDVTCDRTPAPRELPRATWIWKHEGLHLDEGRREILGHARALGLEELYVFLSVDATPSDLDARAALADLAAAEGMALTWVLGDPRWAADAGGALASRGLARLAALAERLGPAARSSAWRVQFDVEPYLLEAWQTDRPSTIRRYLEVIASAADGTRLLGFEPWIVIPFWFDGVDFEGRPLHEQAIERADGVVVMAYMNRLEKILEVAWTEVVHADRVGSRIVLAVETKCIEPQQNSYCVRGRSQLEQDLAGLEAALEGFPALEALAVHDFSALGRLADGSGSAVEVGRKPAVVTP